MGVYRWKEGARFRADVEVVVQELQSLPEQTPENALEYADQHSDSELHKCVTWDDARAAHLYRLEEMRGVIRSVVILDESPGREPITYRAFEYVVDKVEGQSGARRFISTPYALSNDDYRKQVMGDIQASIGELSRKAKTYRYLAQQEFDAAQQHLDLAREALKV